MTTIIIQKEKGTFNDSIFYDLGFALKSGIWSKKVDMSQIREEIERLQTLKINSIEVLLD